MKIQQLLEISLKSDEYVNDKLLPFKESEFLPGDRRRTYFKRHPEIAQIVNNLKQNPDFKYVGSGLTAHVHKLDNPHEMDRVHRISPNYDGTFIYLQYIATHQDQCYNNPFFPRILAAPSKLGNQHSTVQLEHLLPFHTPKIIENTEFLPTLWEQYFTLPRMPHQSFGDIVQLIEHGLIERRTDFVRYSSLKKAMNIICELKEKTPRCFIDLHEQNVMWRMTGLMPQLVITDPLHATKPTI